MSAIGTWPNARPSRRTPPTSRRTPTIRPRPRSASIQATIPQRQAELDAAQVNLDYTNIISPHHIPGGRHVCVPQCDSGADRRGKLSNPTLFSDRHRPHKNGSDLAATEQDLSCRSRGSALPRVSIFGQAIVIAEHINVIGRDREVGTYLPVREPYID